MTDKEVILPESFLLNTLFCKLTPEYGLQCSAAVASIELELTFALPPNRLNYRQLRVLKRFVCVLGIPDWE